LYHSQSFLYPYPSGIFLLCSCSTMGYRQTQIKKIGNRFSFEIVSFEILAQDLLEVIPSCGGSAVFLYRVIYPPPSCGGLLRFHPLGGFFCFTHNGGLYPKNRGWYKQNRHL
jgi:hypothetical protein